MAFALCARGELVADAEARTAERMVLSPHAGQTVPARPLTIRVHTGLRPHNLRAWLNGRPLHGHFSHPSRRGVRKLKASPSHGLRHGANRLRVRTVLRDGRKRLVTVRFRVRRNRPLAAAGVNHRVAFGERAHLDGERSRLHPGARRAGRRAGSFGHAGLRYRWRILSAPGESRSVVSGDDQPTEMTGARTPTPTIEVDSSGSYEVGLTVTAADGETASDTVKLSGAPPHVDAAPLVGVDTMAHYNGRPGVQLQTYRDVPVPKCPQRVLYTSGEGCFYADPGQAREWVQLVVLDRRDLSLVDNNAFNCDQATRHPQERDFFVSDVQAALGCAKNLADYVNKLNDNELVIAVNQPGDAANNKQQPPAGVGAVLSGKFNDGSGRIANLGIGATGWTDAPDSAQHLAPAVRGTFSAIGVPGWKTGGVSNMPSDPGSWDPRGSGRLETNIAVNNQTRYAPFDPVAADEARSPLVKVLTKPPTSWPTATPGQAAALSAIGASDRVRLTANPRARYYSADLDWSAKLSDIRALHYSDLGPSPGFTEDDFKWAQQQLATEVSYITDVKAYVEALAEPYNNTEKTVWASFGTVVAGVNNATSNGTGAKLWAGAKGVFDTLIDLIPGAGSAFKWSEKAVFATESLIAAYHVGMDFAELGDEPADDGFQVEAASLGNELTTRLNEAEEEVRVRFFNIIVADYGKLRTVALCSTSSSGCDDTQEGWSFTKNGVANMETFLKMGFQRELYTELVPAKYPLALGLEPVSQSFSGKALNDAWRWCRPVPPFTGSVGVYLWPVVDRDYWRRAHDPVPSDAAITPIVLTTGDPGPNKTWYAANWTVFGRMFNAIDPGGDFNKGGLGIDEAEFFADHYGLKGLPYTPSDRFQLFNTTSLRNCPGWDQS